MKRTLCCIIVLMGTTGLILGGCGDQQTPPDQDENGKGDGQNADRARNGASGGGADAGDADGNRVADVNVKDLPKSLDQLQKLLGQFPSAQNDAELTRRLKPNPEDYDDIFAGDWPSAFAEAYEQRWRENPPVIQASPEETKVVLWPVSSSHLRRGRGPRVDQFPQRWQTVAKLIEPRLALVRFAFATPEGRARRAYAALVYVNGRWVYIPEPWDVLRR